MIYTCNLREVKTIGVALLGAKAARLGELHNSSFPVPEGFIITALAYQEIIRENNITGKIKEQLNNLDITSPYALERTADVIQNYILRALVPIKITESIVMEYRKLKGCVAVRSSTTAEDLLGASFAGQHNTFLNVVGEESVVESIKKCISSLFTARALYYCHAKGIDHFGILMAIIVQRMIKAEKAGIMFTINPVTNNRDQIVIEAAFGLGESVVSGELTPDRFIINKESEQITRRSISNQSWAYFPENNNIRRKEIDYGNLPTLSEKEVKALVDYGKQIETIYNTPQDIEWAIDKEGIKILQTRPITTLR